MTPFLTAFYGRLLARISEMESLMRHLASFDSLTGLHSRYAVIEPACELVDTAIRYHKPLTVLYADLDHFKAVNDTYGHEPAMSS